MTPGEVRAGVAHLSRVERLAVEEAVGLALAAAFVEDLRREDPERFRIADAEAGRLIREGHLDTPEGKVRLREALLALARSVAA